MFLSKSKCNNNNNIIIVIMLSLFALSFTTMWVTPMLCCFRFTCKTVIIVTHTHRIFGLSHFFVKGAIFWHSITIHSVSLSVPVMLLSSFSIFV